MYSLSPIQVAGFDRNGNGPARKLEADDVLKNERVEIEIGTVCWPGPLLVMADINRGGSPVFLLVFSLIKRQNSQSSSIEKRH